MKKVLIFLLFVSSFNINTQAQTPRTIGTNHNAWFMYFGSHKFASKWGVHLEAQLRRADGVANAQQLLLRTGLNYHFAPTAFATLGYAFVETSPYGDFPAKSKFPENRIWEQIQLKQAIGRVELVNRFRLEQRFVKSPVAVGTEFKPGDAVYSNRFRSLHRISIPLKGKAIVDKSLYLTAYNELFVSWGKKVAFNLLDQNRAYIALGYKIPKVGRLELGYLNQKIVKSDGIKVENNHTLMFGLNSTIDFKSTKS
jgi:Protein of unknown function (DUF2490)